MISRPRVPERWRRFDVTVRDLPLALAFLAATFLPALQSQGTRIGSLPDRPFDALALAAVALQCLPLAVRRRWPVVCLALVSLGFAADQLRGYHSVAGAALPIALVSAGAHLERHRRATALLFSAAYVPLAVALSRLGSGEPPGESVTFYLALVLAWGTGAWLRSTRAAEAAHRLRVAEETRAAERTRIARELHDVVTHHVTAMVVQAEAARYLTAAPDRLDGTLAAVSDTGRRALTDLRHLLDLLSPGHSTEAGSGARAPSAGGLLTLVEQTRRAGQPVEFTEEGTPAVAAGSADLVAHRVVQESLTNALKYAHGSPTSVRVRHGGQEITVEVGTDGPGSRAGSTGGSGRGLAGLRERVEVLGGDFSAGPGAGGGFVVRARIPAGSPS
ncbi:MULTISPECIES: sensor histidine kinase [Streptomyces]|uniref:histidine kinase n=2 Tax=Streptomyces TaxID=1883 RepID=A0A420UWZ9_9ACTN|nr:MULTISPECIES: histidine kinase [Streptomyces]KNE83942.1 histidine kinase [Streptomyces fradiae]OFA47697.1 two-component sensor histidine kinase [Streptomyces fradiae]PQM23819.1 two-component sensor histidine kinase [Streptomyces xinghaiensis]RKM92070.1 two-component sensor histidine kinase [Streptomyces xinghaiensis]RNC73512.1 two-component sensor histidine kinase [Streptomyces xinghaiensis]